MGGMPQRIVRVCLGVGAIVGLLALLGPGAAWGGRYHVYSCRTPDGAVAPVDGWSGTLGAGGAFDDYVIDSCSSGGALVAALGSETRHRAYIDRATWTFTGPAGATLVAANLWRAGYVHGSSSEEASYEFWLAGPLLKDPFEECVYVMSCRTRGEVSQRASDVNRVTVPPKNLDGQLALSVSCGAGIEGSECNSGLSDPNNYAAALYLYAADLTLEQTSSSSVTAVGGELATSPSRPPIPARVSTRRSSPPTATSSKRPSLTKRAVAVATSGRRRMGFPPSSTCSRARRRSRPTSPSKSPRSVRAPTISSSR